MGNIPKTIRFALGFLLLAVFIIGGFYLYNKTAKKPISSPISLPSQITQKNVELLPGLKAAQKMFTDNPEFVKNTFIQQQIDGTLKSSSEKSWTLETGGKTVTITNQGINPIRYIKVPKIASGSATQAKAPLEIKPEELKTGDLVSINQMIDWQTGNITVVGITVLP